MYGNNNYPNDFDGNQINETQGIYSGYQNIPTQPKPPKRKKEHRILKKLAVAAGVGLCFGVFAGAGF